MKDFEEGLALANASQFANGFAIFTQSGYYGHKDSFFGDLHVLGWGGVAFYTEAKSVTSRCFAEGTTLKVTTWKRNIARA